MADRKPRSAGKRVIFGALRVLGSMALTVARVIGTMGGAHSHTADSDRVLNGPSKRKDYRP